MDLAAGLLLIIEESERQGCEILKVGGGNILDYICFISCSLHLFGGLGAENFVL